MSTAYSRSLWQRLRATGKGNDLRAQLLRGGMGSLAVKVVSLLLGFVLAVLLARVLGPENYGIYGFTLALVRLVAIPAQVGLPNLVVRETAKAGARENWALMRGIWRWATNYVVISSVLLLGCVWLGLFLFDDRLSDSRFEALIVALPLIPLVALGNIRAGALRGLHLVVLSQIPEKIIRISVFIIFSLVFLLMMDGETFNASRALGLNVLAAATAFFLGATILWKVRPAGVRNESSIQIKASQWRRAVIPLAMISGLQFLNSHADILLLGLLRGDREVGLYRVAVQFANLVVFGLGAINMVLHPHIAKLHMNGEHEKLQRLAILSARVVFILALPPVLVFVLFGPWLLGTIFGDEYSPAYVPLAILVIGQLVNAGMGSVGALLNMTGHESDTARVMLGTFIMNIVLNLVLIPQFGIGGAATATTVTFVAWNIILWRLVRKRLGIKSASFSTL